MRIHAIRTEKRDVSNETLTSDFNCEEKREVFTQKTNKKNNAFGIRKIKTRAEM
jgi:translation elongation factor EF-1beta